MYATPAVYQDSWDFARGNALQVSFIFCRSRLQGKTIDLSLCNQTYGNIIVLVGFYFSGFYTAKIYVSLIPIAAVNVFKMGSFGVKVWK